jgi:hypothetical protein
LVGFEGENGFDLIGNAEEHESHGAEFFTIHHTGYISDASLAW